MMEMMGAMRAPALAAPMASKATRRPRLSVFQERFCSAAGGAVDVGGARSAAPGERGRRARQADAGSGVCLTSRIGSLMAGRTGEEGEEESLLNWEALQLRVA